MKATGGVGASIRWAVPLAIVVGLGATPGPASANGSRQPKVVYGPDDRREVYNLTGARAAAAAATVALVDRGNIVGNGSGTSTLIGSKLGAGYNLCAGQRFAQQPTAAFCSGVLAGPDVVLTAGHCLEDRPLSSIRFVFGFRMSGAGRAQTEIANSAIYGAKQVLASKVDDADYAVIRLSRKVGDVTPAPIKRGGATAVGTPIYVIGHPSGLPAKIAAGARVLRSADPNFFDANLDTFGGNSGSPVFSAANNTVIGLIVRGLSDYRESGGCNVVNTLSDAEGDEDVTKTTAFATRVPK